MTARPLRALPPGRCPRCAFPPAHCICGRIPRIDLPLRITVLRHASEIPRLTGSARWAALALPGTRVLDYALPGAPLDPGALEDEGAWVLFPSARPTPPGGPRPAHLVVPDGTWQQARRMMQRVPALQRMPRLSLPPARPAPRLRRPPRPGGMSTLEAIAEALGFLGFEAEADRLRALHHAAVDEASRLRGMPANVA